MKEQQRERTEVLNAWSEHERMMAESTDWSGGLSPPMAPPLASINEPQVTLARQVASPQDSRAS